MTKILILDDGGEMRTLITLILEREGYELFYADDGQIAVGLLRDGSYKLLIMDSGFRGDWWEFYNSMKADTILRTIGVIILLPRFTLTEEAGRMLEKVWDNEDGLLTKPFHVKDLIELVKKILRNYGYAPPVLE